MKAGQDSLISQRDQQDAWCTFSVFNWLTLVVIYVSLIPSVACYVVNNWRTVRQPAASVEMLRLCFTALPYLAAAVTVSYLRLT